MSSKDAITSNQKVLGTYSQKLSSSNIQTFAKFADRFGSWLKSERAYYLTARPKVSIAPRICPPLLRSELTRISKILELLEVNRNPCYDVECLTCLQIAQSTVRRETALASQNKHPSTFQPWVEAYFRLIREVIPHIHLFTEPGAQGEVYLDGGTMIKPSTLLIFPLRSTAFAPTQLQ